MAAFTPAPGQPGPPKSRPKTFIRVVGTIVSILAIAMGLFWIVIGAITAMAPGGPNEKLTERVEAMVTRVVPSADEFDACSLNYRFMADEKSYTGSSGHSSGTYCRYAEGDTIEVVYDPDRPVDNALTNKGDASAGIIGGVVVTIMGVIPLIIGAVGLLLIRWWIRRDRAKPYPPPITQPVAPLGAQSFPPPVPISGPQPIAPFNPQPITPPFQPMEPQPFQNFTVNGAPIVGPGAAGSPIQGSQLQGGRRSNTPASIGSAIFMILFGLGFMAGGLFFIQMMKPGENQTAEAEGYVTALNRHRSTDTDGGTSTSCSIDYAFEVAGETYEGSSSVGSSSYCSYGRGKRIDIRYDPADPWDSSYLDKSVSGAIFLWGFVAVGAVISGFGVRGGVKAIRGRRSGPDPAPTTYDLNQPPTQPPSWYRPPQDPWT
ncbi:MAG: DUF3592 domain-containing protein [Bifidobacteriaceae bacterium]|jgi:hypothetical protein|nr:DUF3592 domain-containing protein [Bifidobacteriaceae bacterium]